MGWPLLNRSARWQLRRLIIYKRKGADARAKAKAAQQSGPSPQSLVVTGDGDAPLTHVAGGVVAGGSVEPEDSAA